MLDRFPTDEECATPTPTRKRHAYIAVGRKSDGAEVRVSCVEREGAQYLLDHWDQRKILPLRIEMEPPMGFPQFTPDAKHKHLIMLSEASASLARLVKRLAVIEHYVAEYGHGSIGDATLTWTHASANSGYEEMSAAVSIELRKGGMFTNLLDATVASQRAEVNEKRAKVERLMTEALRGGAL